MADVNIKGLKETMQLLRHYEADQSKIINKRMTDAAMRVRDAARSDIPSGDALTNWGQWGFSRDGRDLGFIGQWVKGNIKVTRRAGRNKGQAVSNYIGLVSLDAAGVIYQTTGHAAKNSDGVRLRTSEKTSSKGQTFVANMLKKHPGKRGIWKAYDEDEGRATAEIEGAAREAEAIVQRRLNGFGG